MSNAALSWARAQRGMTPAAKAVLMVLADCANGDRACWPSQQVIADDCCLKRTTIPKAIAELIKLGLISATRTGRASKYLLRTSDVGETDIATQRSADIEHQMLVKDTSDVGEPDTNPKEPSRTQKEGSSLRSAAEPNPVEQIWARGLAILGSNRRSLLGKLVKDHGQVAVLEAIVATEAEMPVEPAAFLIGCLARAGPKVNGNHHPGTYRPGALAAFAEGAFNAAQAYNRKHGLDIENDLSPAVALLGR